MAAAINLGVYSDAMVVLATAGVIVPVVSRLGANPIISYLALGALLGPLGLGKLTADLPIFYWLTIVDAANVRAIADLGIVFLLFLIGLELSLARLAAMRRLVLGLGGLQVLLTTLVLTGLATLFGLSIEPALIVGGSLALSSTAIVLELLSAKNRMAGATGRASFSILLAQDIAVVPLLIMISVFAQGGGNIMGDVGLALAQAFASLAVIVFLGRVFLRPLFRLVGSLAAPEVFLAAVLFVIVGSGFVAALFGLSMALGAFVAGLLLAETEYRKAVEAIVEPFKGLLLGIFFFTVGLGINPAEIILAPGLVVLLVALLLGAKMLVLFPLSKIFGLSRPTRIETALLLAPGGEFAFVGVGAALAAGLLDARIGGLVLTAVALSMALIPLFSLIADRINGRIARASGPDPVLALQPDAQSGHAIVIGYGRVGKVVAEMLGRAHIPHLAIDSQTAVVARERRAGNIVYYGDAASPAFLAVCGLPKASLLVVTIQDDRVTDKVIELVRSLRPDIPVVARARDANHARHLYNMGVTTAVPETIEASLQLSEAALVAQGMAMGRVIAAIHDRRDEFRKELAAGKRGDPA